MAVRNRLKEILESKGLKQNWLAKQVGITTSTMTTLVQNKYSTSIDTAYKIAKVLNMEVTEIFYDESDSIDSK